jgi:hypothetical protein
MNNGAAMTNQAKASGFSAHQELFDGLGATDTRKPASNEELAAIRQELDDFMRAFSSVSEANQ